MFLIVFIGLIFVSNKYSTPTSKQKNNRNYSDNRYQENNLRKDFSGLNESEKKEIAENTKGIGTKEKIVSLATSLLGKNYTIGGKSPKEGFDCSGFTQYVFKKQKIEIPPSSITQSQVGEVIPLKEANMGDLIFFKSPTEGNNSIGHVGIVISNNDNGISFVHSSTSRGVVIDNLDNPHYKSRFRLVRRIIAENGPKIASNQL